MLSFKRLLHTPLLFLIFASPLVSAIEIFNDSSPFRIELQPNNTALETLLRQGLIENATYDTALKELPPLRRAKIERGVLEKLLRAEAYYEAQVSVSVAETEGKEKTALRVFKISSGPLYRIGALQLNFPSNLPKAPELAIKPGDTLRAEKVLQAREVLQNWVNRDSCLYNAELSHRALLDPNSHEATLVFSLQSEGRAVFGKVHFSGLEKVQEKHLLRVLSFKSGDCFRRSTIEQSRLELLQTQLLSSADYSLETRLSEASSDAGETKAVQVNFKVQERPPRTFKAGANYSTDGGPGLLLGLAHRNLMGWADQLEIEGGANDIKQHVSGRYSKPAFFLDEQTLTLSAKLQEENPEAFSSTKFQSSAVVSRQLGEHTNAEVGLAFTRSSVTEDEMKEDFSLISVPLGLRHDYRDNLLDARKGWYFSLALSPFYDLGEEHTQFLRWNISSHNYYSVDKWLWSPTFALRSAAGSIQGASLSRVPADERFYVGGGGSVRGYAYQSLGELTDEKPDGGLSFGELNMELRLRLKKNWGFVVFLDGGYAYPETIPGFGEDFRWGTGFGLRYLTSFAPIRFDLGIPLDGRDGIDDDFQLYVSVGQSF